MKRVLSIIALIAAVCSGAWAQRITVGTDITHGTVAVDNASPTGAATVTLTVTPATNYYITASDIVVTRTALEAQAPRRTPDIGSKYNVTAVSVDATGKGTYTFNVEDGYGAYVEAIFTACAAITPSVTLDGWTYGETANSPSVSGNPGGGAVTFSYKVKDADDATYTTTVPTAANTYTVRAVVAAAGHYLGGTATADFTIATKALTITADSETKVYDGTALTKNSYTNTDPATGDAITSVTVTGSQTTVGNSNNVPSAAVIKKGDTDVTSNYDITYVNGTLTVTKKTVKDNPAAGEGTINIVQGGFTITGGFTYNGLEQKPTITVKDGETTIPANEYTVTIKDSKGNTVTNPTNVDTYTIEITDNDGGNYDVSGQTTFIIATKALTITADSETKVYDGTALTKNSYTNTDLATGDAITSVTVTGSQTTVGNSNNVPSAAVIKKGDTDVTSNYDITYVNGTLTVSPLTTVVVTITGHYNKAAYDGTEHSVSGYDVSISNNLYKESDFTFNGTASAARTDVGKTMMGLAASQFTNTNPNFTSVTFNITDGYQEITSIDEVIVTITGHINTTDYDGTEHSVSGYDVSFSNALYTAADFTFSGTASAARTDAGKTMMGLSASQFTNTSANYGTVTFVVTDGYQEISPITATVTITGHNDVVAYDGTEHSVTGYDVSFSNNLYKETDFTFSGTAEAKRTDEGKTMMGLAADQFTNTNANFDGVTFNVTDGYMQITAVTDVVVTITGHNNTTDYDGTEHSVSGYDVKISNPLYKESYFTFSGTAEAKRTDAGKTMMGLEASQFANKNVDFTNVTFNVTDGYQTISPITATVTIKGHSDIVVYDGTEHKVSGYDATFSNNVYKETDFTFTGTAEAARTDQGTTEMGLAANQFTNNNTNFSTVTFSVIDGYQTINKKAAALTVTVTPKSYDGNTDAEVSVAVDTHVKGESLTITGLTGTFDNASAGTDKTVTVNSSAAVVTAGENTKLDNYEVVYPTQAKGTITQLTGVVVTITGHNNKAAFDGKEHSVSGYDVSISNNLYKESDFTFSGTASAARTEVGKTMMGLAADQFTNNNANFDGVTFNVTDGYQEITSIDEVIVTITGHINTSDYDGTEHSVSGYDVSFSNALYTAADFTFSGTAEAKRTDAGKTMMGLSASQFTNTNTNFGNVVFVVTDGYQEISPITATVTITGHNNTVTYDGEEHSVSGYDVSISNNLYKESDFTFSGTAEAKRTDEGTTYMGLTADQFANINTNFSTVTFNVTDGYLQITAVTDVVVTITGHSNTTDFDGTEHSVSGYDVKISNPLYKESYFTFSGTAEAKRTDAGKTMMGLEASQFANKNVDFTNVTFKVTDGYQEISPITVTVTIKGHSDIVVYDGTEHSVSGYDVSFSNALYTEADFTFSGTAEAKRTDAGKTMMGMAADQYANTNTNFSTVTFSVIDGYQAINKKVPVLTVTVTPKTYDGNINAEVSVVVDTRVKDESITITGLTGTFDNANVGADKTVTVNSSQAVVTAGENTKLDNYEVTYPTQAKGTITKRPVVVSGITAQDKDYDGTTDVTLVFDNVQFEGLLAGDNLTVTATGKFEDAEAGENKTVVISDLTLGGESVANYELAADGQQTATTATIRQTITIDRRHSGIIVQRNDTNEPVDNDAFLTVMADGMLRIDQISIINPDPVNGIAAGVSIHIPAILKDYDGTTGAIYGVASDIIVTDANVPVTDIYMPETDEMMSVAANAFRLNATASTTARIHTTLALLDDYALTPGLQAEYEAGHVVASVQVTSEYWTLSCGVDVALPNGVTPLLCKIHDDSSLAAYAITEPTVQTDEGKQVLLLGNNGVLMKSKIGQYMLTAWPSAAHPSGSAISTEPANSYEGNLLICIIERQHLPYNEGYFVLKDGLFHPIKDNAAQIPAGRAVAHLPKTSPASLAPMLRIVEVETTSVETLSDVGSKMSDVWYTLDGRKLDKQPTTKGVYVRNGVKVVVK